MVNWWGRKGRIANRLAVIGFHVDWKQHFKLGSEQEGESLDCQIEIAWINGRRPDALEIDAVIAAAGVPIVPKPGEVLVSLALPVRPTGASIHASVAAIRATIRQAINQLSAL